MKRFIAIFVALFLVISLFTVTVLADSDLPSTAKQIDFLDFIPSFTFEAEAYSYDSIEPVFVYNQNIEIDSFSILFGADHATVPPLMYRNIYLVFSTLGLGELDWTITLESSNDYFIADFYDSIYQNGFYYYVYSFDLSVSLSELRVLTFEFPTPSDDFTLEILEFYSDLGSRSISLSNGDLLIEGTMQAEGEGYYNQIFYDGNLDFPVQYDVGFTKPNAPADDYLTAYLSLFSPVTRADRLVLSFISTGVYDNYYDHTQLTTGGLYYYSYNNLSPAANVPINAYYSHMQSSWQGMDLWRITVVADISSIDFEKGFLTFSTSFNDSVPTPSNPQYRDYFIRFESAVLYLDTLTDVPWYKQMYNWIADLLWVMNGSINSWFQRIELKLDQLIGTGQPSIDLRDQENQIQDIVTDMDDLGNRLEQSGSELDSLMPSMPTWEDTGLGNLAIDYSANINSILMIFHAIYENQVITQILAFTFLFALGGFILFGER